MAENTFIIGLGNPGEKYQYTRHNAGFLVIDALAAQLGAQFAQKKKLHAAVAKVGSTVLVKPQTYMNDSGRAVAAVRTFFSAPKQTEYSDVFVLYDDLDLSLGKFKLSLGHGPKQHNGLLSIKQHLGTDAFWLVRIGVDERNGDRSMSGRDYVLQRFDYSGEVFQSVSTAIVTELQQRIQ